MKEILISKRNIIVAIILAVVIALGILMIQALPQQPESQPPVSNQADTQASEAAVSALEAFFHVDYHSEKDTWLNEVCAESTPTGCQLISVGADSLWSKFQDGKADVTAAVIPQEKLAETDTEQVWKILIELSAPLPGSNKIQDIAYVAVVKTDHGWKFDRFLLEPEINAILTRPTVTEPSTLESK